MDMAQKHGYNVLLCDSMDSEEKELKHITALCRHHVDGVIWEPVSENSIQYEHYFQEQDIAVSYINSSFRKPLTVWILCRWVILLPKSF